MRLLRRGIQNCGDIIASVKRVTLGISSPQAQPHRFAPRVYVTWNMKARDYEYSTLVLCLGTGSDSAFRSYQYWYGLSTLSLLTNFSMAYPTGRVHFLSETI